MHIHNKSIEQIAEELTKPFPMSALKDNPAGFSYIEYETFRNRLDEVVGVFNYDFIVTSLQWTTIGEKSQVSCIGTLTIRDDEGKAITCKSATGCVDVITRNADGIAIKPGNDAKSAEHDAFKSCCRMLGIGDAQLREKRKAKKSNSNNYSRGTSTTNTSSTAAARNNMQLFQLHINGAFKSAGSKGFKAPAVIKESGEVISLVAWSEGIAEVEKYMPFAKFAEAYKDKDLRVYGTKETFTMRNGSTEEQIILGKPYVAKEGK